MARRRDRTTTFGDLGGIGVFLGIVLSLLSAASFGVNEAMTRRGIVGASASQGMYITVTLGVPLFLLGAVITGQAAEAHRISVMGWIALAAAGVVHFLLGRYCNYRSIGAIGANRSQPLRSTALLYSVVVAVIVLHEELTLGRTAGIALLTIGALLMVERSPRSTPQAEPAPAPEPLAESSFRGVATLAPPAPVATARAAPTRPLQVLEGYGFGLLAGFAYGMSPILIRWGLEGTQLGLMGGFASYLAASLVLLSTLFMPGRWAYMRSMSGRHARWFVGSGVFVFLAQMFRYLALGVAPVVLVAPLGQLNGLFMLGLSWGFNRQLESFSPRVIIGVLMSVVGGIVLIF